ncbi:polysaccharide pyruvyl transferase family protein [Butyrivibrio sp. WCD2001]|uniref:polysaccharide pyruvyl transferase family protein n=1 Tax=Butyrivibrio sp. WCD2001 TaxID=1280681 RepID=UPI0004159F75|nr:polysaccharide pyruvyl transferase family protein [Butyrivibrio sp. WCD2001]
MKCGILTFHFAHNYGAVLQAYALKNHIKSMGHEAEIIDYVPEHLKRFYSNNPFVNGKRLRSVSKQIIRIHKNKMQFKRFGAFISDELLDESSFDADLLLCGSDQIWNNQITGNSPEYFAGVGNYKRIASYAASFGSSELDEYQKDCIKKYLPGYSGISLREGDLLGKVSELSGKDVELVMDPVFLMDKQEWHSFSNKAINNYETDYILYYALRNDDELKDKAKKLSEKLSVKVYCIHPTGKDLKTEFTQLYDVGPYEFVNLIENAKYIVTNSFHAMAFSTIFGKKAIYKAYSKTESRVPSLLKICDAKSSEEEGVDCYDLARVDKKKLDEKIASSKSFLKTVLDKV